MWGKVIQQKKNYYKSDHPFQQSRKCVKEGCGKWFSIARIKIKAEYYLCSKHREELHQQEAEDILKRRENKELDLLLESI